MKEENTYKGIQNRVVNIILSLGFILLLIIPIIQEYFILIPPMESKENRQLADKPILNPTFLDHFPSVYEDYFNDHFSFRNHLVHLNSLLLVNILQKSPMPEKVLFGDEGWLYLVKDELDTYRGKNLFNSNQLKDISEEMLRRKKYLDTRGIKMYFAIVPSKYTVYPEYLPYYVNKLNAITRTHQIITALADKGIETIDLRQPIIDAKKAGLLYYKTDNHWNEHGSFVAYNIIMQRIKKDFQNIRHLSLEDFKMDSSLKTGGNITRLLNMEEEFEDVEFSLEQIPSQLAQLVAKEGYIVPGGFPYAWEYELNYETGVDSLANILFIRDSFGYSVIPYFAESFNRSVFIFDNWRFTSNEHIIENEKPDIVIYLVLESMWDTFLEGIYISQNNNK